MSRIIICKECGKKLPHRALGMCRDCYAKDYNKIHHVWEKYHTKCFLKGVAHSDYSRDVERAIVKGGKELDKELAKRGIKFEKEVKN